MMWNETPITTLLEIDYPIIQAGMAGGVTTPELIAEVSNAGGLGSLGAGYMKPEQMREAIQEVKRLTNKPFAVNIFIPEFDESSKETIEKANDQLRSYRSELGLNEQESADITSYSVSKKQYKEKLQIVVEENVSVCSFTFGLPSHEDIEHLKNNGMVLIGTATTVKEAKLNEEIGMDVVVMQGMEAGGHRGTFAGAFHSSQIGLVSLIPQAVDHVNIPIIAAGGIMDGRGILSMLVLGAAGVQMGTAFVTCLESGANPLHKLAILNSAEDQTVVTSVFSGKPARGIENEFIANMTDLFDDGHPGYPTLNSLTRSIRKEAAEQKRPELMSLWSGQSPRLSVTKTARELIVTSVKQVETIVKQ